MPLQRSGKLCTQSDSSSLIPSLGGNYAASRFQGAACRSLELGTLAALKSTHTKSVQAARPASWRAAHPRRGLDETKLNNRLLKHVLVRHTLRQREEESKTKTQRVRSHSSRFQRCHTVTPNPSIERTRSGRPLQAIISFLAFRSPPPRAAHVKR